MLNSLFGNMPGIISTVIDDTQTTMSTVSEFAVNHAPALVGCWNRLFPTVLPEAVNNTIPEVVNNAVAVIPEVLKESSSTIFETIAEELPSWVPSTPVVAFSASAALFATAAIARAYRNRSEEITPVTIAPVLSEDFKDQMGKGTNYSIEYKSFINSLRGEAIVILNGFNPTLVNNLPKFLPEKTVDQRITVDQFKKMDTDAQVAHLQKVEGEMLLAAQKAQKAKNAEANNEEKSKIRPS